MKLAAVTYECRPRAHHPGPSTELPTDGPEEEEDQGIGDWPRQTPRLSLSLSLSPKAGTLLALKNCRGGKFPCVFWKKRKKEWLTPLEARETTCLLS